MGRGDVLTRRVLTGLGALVVGIALVVAFALVVNSRDDATTSSEGRAPGEAAQAPAAVRSVTGKGNVVIEAPGAQRTAVERLVQEVTGLPADDQGALLRAGVGVEVRSAQAGDEVRAYAGARVLRTRDVADPELRRFVEFWLGRKQDE